MRLGLLPLSRSPVWLVLLPLVALAGCGGSASAERCRRIGERFPRQSISVSRALQRQGALELVDGSLIVRNGKPERICSSLLNRSPPRCVEPSLRIEGYRDLVGSEISLRSQGHVQWAVEINLAGRVDGKVLRLEPSCPTQRVLEGFRKQTGELLGFEVFLSTVAVERLDAGLPSAEPARLRRKYGYFSVLVAVDGRPIRLDLQGRRADPSGIVWNKESGKWIAIKRYQPGIVVGWLAGKTRRLDERWRRLDSIVTDIAG